MNIPIVYENLSFLVIDKPGGVVVNRSDTTGGIETLQDWVEGYLKLTSHSGRSDVHRTHPESIKNPLRDSGQARMTIESEFKSRSGIVHRLDKDTSGLLVIAKNPDSFENLKNQFKDRGVIKKYLALAHGRVEPGQGTINAPIERSPFNRMHFGVFPGGREATTDYKSLKLLKSLMGESLTLLELTPHTGRTHQIRVHLKYINHPVVSDPIYGGRKNVQGDLKWCPRLFLHAAYLKIKHPVTGEEMEFNSNLPADLAEVLTKLPAFVVL